MSSLCPSTYNVEAAACSFVPSQQLALYLILPTAVAAPAQAPDTSLLREARAAEPEPITPIPKPPAEGPLKLALGERLFYDPHLSCGGMSSCATRHDTRTNGADIRERDLKAHGSLFNTPTVFNAALSFRLTRAGTYRTLRQQAEVELGGDAGIKRVVEVLKADPTMSDEF